MEFGVAIGANTGIPDFAREWIVEICRSRKTPELLNEFRRCIG